MDSLPVLIEDGGWSSRDNDAESSGTRSPTINEAPSSNVANVDASTIGTRTGTEISNYNSGPLENLIIPSNISAERKQLLKINAMNEFYSTRCKGLTRYAPIVYCADEDIIRAILPEDFDQKRRVVEVPRDYKMSEEILERFPELREKSEDFWRQMWRQHVPSVFVPPLENKGVEYEYNTEEAEERLFKPMKLFLFANQDPDEFLAKLSGSEASAAVCGRVFKIGEPNYSCRDCGMDPTCVLCVTCFERSAHKTHRFKISTSSGGGYCDCGDTEAWKDCVHCDAHIPTTVVKNELMTEEIEIRAQHLFKAILNYCVEVILLDMSSRLSDDLIEETSREMLYGENDSYCLVLYNDESHTFEQVIQTLTKSADCTSKEAVDYATLIDKEGRSVIRCSIFQSCMEVKRAIERQTTRGSGRPLKVLVSPAYIIAHQCFALKLLGWLNALLGSSVDYRRIMSDVLYHGKVPKCRNSDAESILEEVMLHDTVMWKAARAAWHHLFISAMLKEYENKKMFSRVFTRNYADLMKEFINDDHDHAFSITSLSVQIFTVPTIAHYLIEYHDLLFTIIRFFMSECELRLNNAKRLDFSRGTHINLFKRTIYTIMDMKYVLSSPLVDWTDKIRAGFLRAMTYFLDLLRYMQEMDTVLRQVGQHMEYEPEWESSFNLHIKLAPTMQLVGDWCGTDRYVFVRTFRSCLSIIGVLYGKSLSHTVTRELANHSASCFDYDIASQPVSVHLPLVRFFACLYLHLKTFDLDYSSSQFYISNKPSPEMIIETPLRTQVLMAQVHAGMWKRNGYSLLNQLFFYQNVRCRSDMFDKDIIALQMGAALIESNEFVLHVLNRFNLFQWTERDYDEKPSADDEVYKYTMVVLSEFFSLMLNLFASRYVPGVGKVTREDCTKKDIIQLLCVEPMTHSNLNKSLVENVNYETGMEAVVNDVADFKRPQGCTGYYELKPEFYCMYDCFHYHYTREEMSKAEERQRKRKRDNKEPEIFPPPTLPPFEDNFDIVVNIFKSDVLLYVVELVLKRCLKKNLRSQYDNILRKVLHLIGHGLNEEKARNLKETNHFFQFSAACANVFTLLEELLKEPELCAHHDMILWLRARYAELRPCEGSPDKQEQLTAIQNSEEAKKKMKAMLAAQSRAKMLAKMNEAQKKFMSVNAALFTAACMCFLGFTEDGNGCAGDNQNIVVDMDVTSQQTVALGSEQTRVPLPDESFTCILCQEEQAVGVTDTKLVMAAFVQRSSVMSQDPDIVQSESDVNALKDHFKEIDYLFQSTALLVSPHVSSCGHIMHNTCWATHMEGVISKERRRPYRLRHPLSFDVDRHEWLCPMCDALCNVVIPICPPLPKYFLDYNEETYVKPPKVHARVDDIELFISGLLATFEQRNIDSMNENQSSAQYTRPLQPLSISETVAQLRKTKEEDGERFSSLIPASSGFSPDVYLHFEKPAPLMQIFMGHLWQFGHDQSTSDSDRRQKPFLWQSVAYTITTAEAYHRDQGIEFFGDNVPSRCAKGLKYLTRVASIPCEDMGTDIRYLNKSDSIEFAVRLVEHLLCCTDSYPCILECDAFSLLVALCYSFPNFYSRDASCTPGKTGTNCDYFIMNIMQLYHMVQIILVNDLMEFVKLLPRTDDDMDVTVPVSGTKFSPETQYLIKELFRAARKPIPEPAEIDFDAIYDHIEAAMLPFLRCCAKFFECLTDIPASKNLERPTSRYEDLVSYLGLPQSLDTLFNCTGVHNLPFKWASHDAVKDAIYDRGRIVPTLGNVSPSVIKCRYPRPLRKLVDLPEDYTELINSASSFACKFEHHDPRTPTMCLTCGTMLCSQSYCCQKQFGGVKMGACSFHAIMCGGGQGLFLRVRECKVFCLSGRNKGCFLCPPYVDIYGETDQGLRRGNPMYLCREKYESLRRLWINHGIPEEIARITENSTTLVTTEWQYL